MKKRRTAYGSAKTFARVKSSFMRQRTAAVRTVAGRGVISGQEQKDITQLNSALLTAGASTASVTLLNGVTQGTSGTTRLGRRITMKSLLLNGQFNLQATTAGASPIRVLVVYDMQSNGAAPAASDVLLADTLTSPMNLSNNRRFKVLVEECSPCIGTAGPQSWSFKRWIKLNHTVEFNTGNAGTVADIQTGSIYMLVYQDGLLITTAPAAFVYSRVRFTDN